MVDVSLADAMPITSRQALGDKMLALIQETMADLGLQEGEYDMWVADLPYALPATTQQLIVAAKGTNSAGDPAQRKRVVGVCEVIAGSVGGHRETVIHPESDADEYMYRYEGRDKYFRYDGITKVVQFPKHGKLVPYDGGIPNQELYKYYPDNHYDGRDTVVIDVEKDGINVQVRYRLEVVDGGDTFDRCPNGTEFWKIVFLTFSSCIKPPFLWAV